jgi:hypothetical protein
VDRSDLAFSGSAYLLGGSLGDVATPQYPYPIKREKDIDDCLVDTKRSDRYIWRRDCHGHERKPITMANFKATVSVEQFGAPNLSIKIYPLKLFRQI